MTSVKFVVVPEKRMVVAVGEKTKGKAVCSQLDEFDITFGENLAKRRMLLSRVNKDLKIAYKEYEDLFAQFTKLTDMMEKNVERTMYLEDKSEELDSEIRLMIGA
jgi:uridine kinase